MPKGSPELTASRKEEIINACEMLYKTMSFKEITIKEIGNATSFTRTSIYNYFQTKEEIFLSLMQREYEKWADEMNDIADNHDTMSDEEFASAIAHQYFQDSSRFLLRDYGGYQQITYGKKS